MGRWSVVASLPLEHTFHGACDGDTPTATDVLRYGGTGSRRKFREGVDGAPI